MMVYRALLSLAVTASLAAQSGTFITAGTGCPLPTPPSLSIDQPPVVGVTPTITCNGLPLDTVVAVMFIGNAPANVPLAFIGAPGCTGLVSGIFASPSMGLAAPTATLDIAIPNTLALVGVTLHMQTLGVSNSAGLVTSDRGTLTVGDGSPVMLRSASCAPSIACTNGGAPILSSIISQTYNVSALALDLLTPRVLTGFRGIGYLARPTWSQSSWKVLVWQGGASTTALDEMLLSPLAGNVATIVLSDTHTTLANGDFLVDLTPPSPISLAAGSYLVAVLPTSSGLAGWAWRENASSSLPSDVVTISLTPTQYAYYSPTLGYVSGVQAVDIFGY